MQLQGFGLRQSRIVDCLSCLFGLISLASVATVDAVDFERSTIEISGVPYSVEIAKTARQRQQGLMWRDSLGANEGMLFVYPRVGGHRIWMKNTLVPLTVAWIDENAVVIGVKILQPCETEYCPSFGVSEPAKYIIELNGDSTDIHPGDQVLDVKRFVANF